MSEMKATAEENRRLKRKQMTENAVCKHGVSIALAYRTFQISETCYGYERKLSDENAAFADWLVRLTANLRS